MELNFSFAKQFVHISHPKQHEKLTIKWSVRLYLPDFLKNCNIFRFCYLFVNKNNWIGILIIFFFVEEF